MTRYESAKAMYAAYGVDTDAAIAKLKNIPVSLHCWQGDDVIGFDHDGPLSGGIQTTGNYPGKARTPDELMADMEKAISLCPGKAKLNVHACYAIFEDGEYVDRDKLEPKHFAKWVALAKKYNMGIDFNPTFFSHPMAAKDGLTLSSPNEEIRKFWIAHGKACIRISEYFAKETGVPCVMNIWTGDGYKDVPADRMGPRMRYKASIEEILSEPFDKNLVKPCVESKVFGIGVEAYTAGSAEFTLSFAASHDCCLPLMDNGHYHPTEFVSDKIPALLCFYPEIAPHITRGIRWDSDHVLLLDDETKEMAKEIVRCDALDRVYMALDYFDASINRVSAWVVGFRSWQKALLSALCTPNEMLKKLQDENKYTELMVMQEEMKTMPFGDIWAEYCASCGVAADTAWFDEIQKYEAEVLSKRA
ncbi:MAG: L-rhamnose isomerase [Clostridia bacterium]|nr:L-rhamnose isomerase [Clostridia bacterium]